MSEDNRSQWSSLTDTQTLVTVSLLLFLAAVAAVLVFGISPDVTLDNGGPNIETEFEEIYVGERVTLQAESEVTWTVNGEEVQRGESLSLTFSRPGEKKVVARSDKGSTTVRLSVLEPEEPKATLSLPESGVAGKKVRLNASGTLPGINRSLSFDWDIDEDSQPDLKGTGPTVNVSFSSVGAREVTVIANNTLLQSEASATINITNQPPVVVLNTPQRNVTTGQEVTLIATSADSNNQTLSYQWFFDDDSDPEITTGDSSVSTRFMQSGQRTVRVTVSDGFTSVSDSITLNVSE